MRQRIDWFNVTLWSLIGAWVILLGCLAVRTVINIYSYLNR